MKCTDCKYHLKDEYGHSNWSIEGVDIYCLLDLNPGLPEDQFYGEEPVLKFAENCEKFIEGEGICLDVERGWLINRKEPLSSVYTDDPELKILLDKWKAK
jgi:hypothetical protein